MWKLNILLLSSDNDSEEGDSNISVNLGASHNSKVPPDNVHWTFGGGGVQTCGRYHVIWRSVDRIEVVQILKKTEFRIN